MVFPDARPASLIANRALSGQTLRKDLWLHRPLKKSFKPKPASKRLPGSTTPSPGWPARILRRRKPTIVNSKNQAWKRAWFVTDSRRSPATGTTPIKK
jgi:hypothetical protein